MSAETLARLSPEVRALSVDELVRRARDIHGKGKANMTEADYRAASDYLECALSKDSGEAALIFAYDLMTVKPVYLADAERLLYAYRKKIGQDVFFHLAYHALEGKEFNKALECLCYWREPGMVDTIRVSFSGGRLLATLRTPTSLFVPPANKGSGLVMEGNCYLGLADEAIAEAAEHAAMAEKEPIEYKKRNILGQRAEALADRDYAREKAFRCFELAIGQNSAGAWNNLGVMHENGEAPRGKNDALAARCYQQGVRLGDASAMFNLGRCYADGIGVPQANQERAAELFREALRSPA